MADSVKIMKKWFDQCKQYLTDDELDQLYVTVVRYGLDGEAYDTGDPLIDIAFSYIRPQIDSMQASYTKRQDIGREHGRRATYTDEENDLIYELRIDGYSAADIAEVLGVTDTKKIKAIYNSEGWRQAALVMR